MTNRQISDMLSTTAKLMELHGVNEFKVRSVQNAAFTINKLGDDIAELSVTEIESIKGIGKSISQKIQELLSSGTMAETDELLDKTPPGVVEMLSIKGIGPKKVALLWKQLEVESPGELLYACNENRLVELKGFGTKTQEQIKKYIEFSISNEGLFQYAAVEEIAETISADLKKMDGVGDVSFTGGLRRKCEVLNKAELIAAVDDIEKFKEDVLKNKTFLNYNPECNENQLNLFLEAGLNINVQLVSGEKYFKKYFISTGSESHLKKYFLKVDEKKFNDTDFSSEEEIYSKFGMQFIEPELREGENEIDLALQKAIPELIKFENLKGSLHNHSTYSDGSNTLEEMALECKNLGYEYLGICDHSKSAFYANGLSEERVLEQHKEIDILNKKLAPFVIFKGIESDILHNGSLDYSDEFLKHFDFIVASVHSVLKMDEHKATERILKAVENPFTTILGHPTGRLLLAREGYPLNHKAVIDACAQNNVVIELNAHPYRLDLDWRWIKYAVEKGVMISINPDAHHISGYHDMYYGVCVARKGMLTAENTLNTLGVSEITEKFKYKKSLVRS